MKEPFNQEPSVEDVVIKDGIWRVDLYWENDDELSISFKPRIEPNNELTLECEEWLLPLLWKAIDGAPDVRRKLSAFQFENPAGRVFCGPDTHPPLVDGMTVLVLQN